MTYTRQSKTRKSAYNLNKSNGILTHCCIGNSLWAVRFCFYKEQKIQHIYKDFKSKIFKD